MDSERWGTIKRILDEAAAWPAAEKRAFLERECGDDHALLSEVESFLAFDEEVEDFIEDPLWSIRAKGAAGERARKTDPERRIGPYRLLRLLARGGMGVVFLAVREGDYEQQVALKLVSWGMDTEEVLRRFYTERQILANLQHPGIARLLDGGTTDDGAPYFVMEYVEGEPIDQYCETRQLPLSRRLELFRKVCAVVHYAHQNLVVHRDLKPGNILITGDGEPKLLDFGIAKLLQPDRISGAVATMPGQGPMTPDYASPEQIMNLPITTACDVYALGVLLYRLLAGQAPYQLKGRSYDEMVDVVCRTEPRRPSTATAAPATRPGRTGGEAASKPKSVPESDRRVRRRLAGDLDAIVMKAMRKEPHHRYASALELAGDIQRYLSGQPVEARQGTWSYVAGKFFRRHKLALMAVLVILGLAVVSTVLWYQAERERNQAERERQRTEAVFELFTKLFEAANPDEAKGEDLRVSEVLNRARERFAKEQARDPQILADLLGHLATAFADLGLYGQAKEVRGDVYDIRRGLYQADHPALATAANNLADSYFRVRDYPKAEEYFRKALEMWQRLHQDPADLALVMFNLASTLTKERKYAEAEELHLEALAIRQRIFGPDHLSVASSIYGLATVYLERGDAENAESRLREALRIRTKEYGPEHTAVADVLDSLGKALLDRGEYEEAKASLEKALTVRLERQGPGHAKVAVTRKYLAEALLALGDTEDEALH